MFKRVLSHMRESVRTRQYVMTHHARQEMEDDAFTIYDVERGILTGRILERQQDRETGEQKYLIRGEAFTADAIEVVAKISPTGKLVVITVYAP